MLKKMGYAIIVNFLLVTAISAQGARSIIRSARFARPLAMGEAFTGVADGLESVYYNPAGLADLKGVNVIGNDGSGLFFIDWTSKYLSYDFAASANVDMIPGTFAFYFSKMQFDYDGHAEILMNYSLQYGLRFKEYLAVGVSVNYYNYLLPTYTTDLGTATNTYVEDSNNGTADVGLAVLLNAPENWLITPNDELKFGAYFLNIFQSEIMNGEIFQKLRFGTSYKFVPFKSKYKGLSPLKVLLAGDLIFNRFEFENKTYNPNFGLEVTGYEILSLRYGRRNENKIDDNAYVSTPQYPANQFGFGLNIPVHKFVSMCNEVSFRFDYNHTDWDKVNDDEPHLGFIGQTFEDRYADVYSISVNVGL